MATYRSTYMNYLYPHLRQDQRIIVIPFAAYCELNCAIGMNLTQGSKADLRCSGSAEDHYRWYLEDERVVGMSVYRLKNMWGDIAKRDVCSNPAGTGLGLVDQ